MAGILGGLRGILGRFGSRASQEAVGTFAGFGLSSAVEPLSRSTRQSMNRNQPNETLPPPTVAQLTRRKQHTAAELGADTDLDLDSEARNTGFDSKRTAAFLALTRRFPDLELIFEARRRGAIGEEEFRDRVERLGFEGEDVDLLDELLRVLPGLDDVIRFAVREAFDEGVVERFGLDENTPERLAEEAAKRGLDEEDAQFFWRAHWQPPSANQGFEMFHRRKRNPDGSLSTEPLISEDDLRTILRIADFVPGFREELIGIAFSPLTRVDVRRFHREGLMEEGELTRRYRDLGFGPEDAVNMTRFTVAFNSSDERNLTRALIQQAFLLGQLTATETVEELRGIGFSEERAELIVEQIRLAEEEDLKDQEIRVVRSRLINGDLDPGRAEILLDEAGVSGERRDQLVASWERQRDANVDRLPRGTLGRLYREGVIEEDTYREELTALRVPERQQEWLVTLNTPGAPGE